MELELAFQLGFDLLVSPDDYMTYKSTLEKVDTTPTDTSASLEASQTSAVTVARSMDAPSRTEKADQRA